LWYVCLFKPFKKKIIWDLHELPHPILSKFAVTKSAVKFILNNVDLVIYTNKERRDCVLKMFPFNEKKYVILNNYPDDDFITAALAPIAQEVKANTAGLPYVLWMGNATYTRNFFPVLRTLVNFKDKIKLVVMGSVEPALQKYITEQGLDDFVFSKFVSQAEIMSYVDNAMFSIVLYKQSSLNNTYCEPNRLYQLIARHIPVIAGNNPTMKDVLEKYGAGIVLPDDGSDESALLTAVNEMMLPGTRERIRAALNALDFQQIFSWEHQFEGVYKQITSL